MQSNITKELNVGGKTFHIVQEYDQNVHAINEVIPAAADDLELEGTAGSVPSYIFLKASADMVVKFGDPEAADLTATLDETNDRTYFWDRRVGDTPPDTSGAISVTSTDGGTLEGYISYDPTPE